MNCSVRLCGGFDGTSEATYVAAKGLRMPFAHLTQARHHLLVFASATSLLLCVLSIALWFRSQSVMDRLVFTNDHTYLELNGRRGGVWVLWETRPQPRLRLDVEYDRRSPNALIQRPFHWWHELGFLVERSVRGGIRPGVATRIAFPYWFIVILTGVMPARLLTCSVRRRRQQSQGVCVRCGYDLRASSGQCPECGTKVGHTAHARVPPGGPMWL